MSCSRCSTTPRSRELPPPHFWVGWGGTTSSSVCRWRRLLRHPSLHLLVLFASLGMLCCLPVMTTFHHLLKYVRLLYGGLFPCPWGLLLSVHLLCHWMCLLLLLLSVHLFCHWTLLLFPLLVALLFATGAMSLVPLWHARRWGRRSLVPLSPRVCHLHCLSFLLLGVSPCIRSVGLSGPCEPAG